MTTDYELKFRELEKKHEVNKILLDEICNRIAVCAPEGSTRMCVESDKQSILENEPKQINLDDEYKIKYLAVSCSTYKFIKIYEDIKIHISDLSLCSITDYHLEHIEWKTLNLTMYLKHQSELRRREYFTEDRCIILNRSDYL